MATASPRHGDSQGGMGGIVLIAAMILALGAASWGIWSAQSTQILRALFLTVGHLSEVAQHAPFLYPDSISSNFPNWANSLHLADPRQYGWDTAKVMIGVVSHTASLIFVPLIVLRIWSIRKVHIVNRFVRRFNLKHLTALNAKDFAAVASIQHENLLASPINEGPWAVARSPIDWALERELIYAEKRSTGGGTIKRLLGIKSDAATSKKLYIKGWNEKKMSWSVPERRKVLPAPALCRLDEARTDEALKLQLGGLWSGVASLDKFEQAVLAILLTCICKSLQDARMLALRLAQSFKRCDSKGRHNPTIDVTGIDKIINRYINDPRIRQVVSKHAFKSTVYMGLLERAWKRGVFITAEFLWLRPVHRELFLAMNQLGGDRPFAQGTGSWAHYIVEKEYGTAVKVPCVEGGTESIRQILFEEEWIGSEEGVWSEVLERRSQEGTENQEDSPTAKARV